VFRLGDLLGAGLVLRNLSSVPDGEEWLAAGAGRFAQKKKRPIFLIRKLHRTQSRWDD
jgi:hypothetical protein